MNNIIQLLQQDFMLFLIVVGILSFMMGSFLNVVIVRLPIMLDNISKAECQGILAISNTDSKLNKTFNLFTPSSYCPKCNHKIKPWDNIPLISFILLKGKCRYCKKNISLTYPVIETLTFALSMFIAWKFGIGPKTICALILIWTLIAQSSIDFKHLIIPDEITMPVLWLGLLINCFAVFVTPISAISGAVAGYLTLWIIYWLFKLLTKKEGMGYGDFKLLAMLGAWLGWQQLPLIIILSSLLGSIVGAVLIITKNKSISSAIPFGPFLAIAGLVALLYGQEINALYLNYSGIGLYMSLKN